MPVSVPHTSYRTVPPAAGQRRAGIAHGALVRSTDCRSYRTNSSLATDDAGYARTLFSGWAGIVRILLDGRRQVVHVLLPGEPLTTGAPPGEPARAITALTPVLVTPLRALDEGEQRSHTARQIWCMQNQICRIGRQNAYERIANLLAELRDRLEATGRCEGDTFEMPLTQDVLGDVLGLTSVHVNRTIQQMRRDGLLRLAGRIVTFTDRPALERLAEYRPMPRS